MNLENENDLFLLIEDIYLKAGDISLDIKDFVSKFLNSEIAENIFNNFDSHYFSTFNIASDLKGNIKKETQKYQDNFISYIAYIQTKFFFKTRLKVKEINSYIEVNYLETKYELYHTLSDEIVIEQIIDDYNDRNNPMRKLRSKNNKLTIKEGIHLYIAKHIISALYPYPFIDYLKYNYDKFGYLEDKDYFFVAYIYKSITNLKKNLTTSSYDKYCFRKQGIYALLLKEKDESLIDEIIPLLEEDTSFTTYYIITRRYLIKIKKGSTKKFYYTYKSNEQDKVRLQYKLRFLDEKNNS